MAKKEIKPVVFQKVWPSPNGVGGSERATYRFTRAIGERIPVAVLTQGEYYRGKKAEAEYGLPEKIFDGKGLTIREIPTIGQITDLVLRQQEEVGIFQVGWGYEHYPDQFIRVLDSLTAPIILRTCERDQFTQLAQELPADQKQPFWDKLKRRLDAVVAISQPLVDEAMTMGFDTNKIHLIYSSVDTNQFSPEEGERKKGLRKELGLPEDKRIFLFVGRMVEAKGADVLLRAWMTLGDDFCENNHLVMVGAVGNEENTKTAVEMAKGKSGITLTGVVLEEEKVAKYLKAADVFVYPSIHNEGLSVSVLEAMSSGLPVVTTQWAATETGMSDLVKPGQTGITYDHRLGQSELRALLRTTEWDKAKSLGDRARRHIVELGIDNRRAADKYIDLYQELVRR